MIRCVMNKYFTIILTIILFTACQSAPEDYSNFEKAHLQGIIYDIDNQPVSQVSIYLVQITPFEDDKEENAENKKEGPIERRQVSDIRGRFLFADLPKGEYKIEYSKEKYEKVQTKIVFERKTQILYAKIISFNQLIQLSQNALENRKKDIALEYINRAEVLDASSPLLQYLKAVYLYNILDYEGAIDILENLKKEGFSQPHINLFLSDLYELKQDDMNAIINLKEYLKSRFDPDAEQRLIGLQEKLDENNTD